MKIIPMGKFKVKKVKVSGYYNCSLFFFRLNYEMQ